MIFCFFVAIVVLLVFAVLAGPGGRYTRGRSRTGVLDIAPRFFGLLAPPRSSARTTAAPGSTQSRDAAEAKFLLLIRNAASIARQLPRRSEPLHQEPDGIPEPLASVFASFMQRSAGVPVTQPPVIFAEQVGNFRLS